MLTADPTACKSHLNCDSVTSYTGFQAAIDSGVVYDEEDEEESEWESGSRSESRHLMWSNGHSLDQDSIQLEVKMYKILSERWSKQQQRHATVNVTLNLETDSGHLLAVSTSATLNWPNLISGSKSLIRFPLTKFGSSVTREVFVENPSSHPLSVQAVIARPSLYPKDFVTSLSSWSGADWKDMDVGQSFKVILNGEIASASRMVTIPVGQVKNFNFNNEVNLLMPVCLSSSSCVCFPYQRIRMGILFEPVPSARTSPRKSSSADPSVRMTSMLLIRNNLTIFDSLRLEGESGQGCCGSGKTFPASRQC